MEWNYRKWTSKQRLLGLLIVAILWFIFFVSRAHAEETVGDHIKHGVVAQFFAGTGLRSSSPTILPRNYPKLLPMCVN